MPLSIGDLARRAGCSVPTVRYYEDIGLISPAPRAANGRRVYGFPDVARLRFIRRSRDFGMRIDQVRELLSVERSPEACGPAKSIISARLKEVVSKRLELEKLQSSLETMLTRCDTQCGPSADCCTIFEDIEQMAA